MNLLDLIKQYKTVKINNVEIPINKIVCFEVYKDGTFVNYSTRESGRFAIKETSCKTENVILIKKEDR